MIESLLGFKNGEYIREVLHRYKGAGPGFDLLRIVLALYIFYGHTVWIAGGADAMGIEGWIAGRAATTVNVVPADVHPTTSGFTGWTRPFHVAAVPIFFALSGFLVSGSAIRLRSVSTFLAFRCLRILPALAIEVTLCAIILGPILTQLPLTQYFSDYHFFRYFGNIFGFITLNLPGLFLNNLVKGVVNANLWTLPPEFYCYAITALLMGTSIFFNKKLFNIIFILSSVLLLLLSLTFNIGITSGLPSAYLITYYFFCWSLVLSFC